MLRGELERYQPWNAQEEADRKQMLWCMDRFSNLWTRENPLAHFTAACWIVNEDRSKVLMVYHNIYQSWSWAGGHADGERDLLAVAVKEAKEETGAAVKPVSREVFSLEALGVAGHVRRGVYVPAHLHLNVTYLLQAEESAPLIVNETETSGVVWLTPKEALSACREPAMLPVYEKLNQKMLL